MNDIPARLAAIGIDIPRSGPLPLADGVTAAGFPSAGDEALDWWRRLRAAHDTTGLWPVLIPSLDDAVSPSGAFGPDPAERVALAMVRYGASVLNCGRPLAGEPEEVLEDLLEQWPEAPERIDRFSLPEPAVHGAVLRHWGERWGAELVCNGQRWHRAGADPAATYPGGGTLQPPSPTLRPSSPTSARRTWTSASTMRVPGWPGQTDSQHPPMPNASDRPNCSSPGSRSSRATNSRSAAT